MSTGVDRRASVAAVLSVLLIGAVGFTWSLGASELYLSKKPLPAPMPLASMPAGSPSWWRAPPPRHEDVIESPEIVETLGTENYLTRSLRTRLASAEDQGVLHEVTLHAAYYTGMVDTVPHVPERCFVGGGLQIGSASRILPIDLDLQGRLIRDQDALEGIVPQTPERYLPATDTSGNSTAYWAMVQRQSESGRWNMDRWQRIPFDPRDLRIRVQEFSTPQGDVFYAGYFFIANGGTTPTAEDVRQLAFKLEDRYAYYLKVQFTSQTAGSHEELAALASSYLQENIGKLLTRVPDWLEVRRRVDAGQDPLAESSDEGREGLDDPRSPA